MFGVITFFPNEWQDKTARFFGNYAQLHNCYTVYIILRLDETLIQYHPDSKHFNYCLPNEREKGVILLTFAKVNKASRLCSLIRKLIIMEAAWPSG